MTIAEFRAWLEGYEASFSGPPTAEQWSVVKAKLARVTQFPAGEFKPDRWSMDNLRIGRNTALDGTQARA